MTMCVLHETFWNFINIETRVAWLILVTFKTNPRIYVEITTLDIYSKCRFRKNQLSIESVIYDI